MAISLLLAPYFGGWYDKISLQYESAFWGLDKDEAITFVGIPLAYIFLIPLIFGLLGTGNKRKWISFLVFIPLIFLIAADKYHAYIPIILVLLGFGVSSLLTHLTRKKVGA